MIHSQLRAVSKLLVLVLAACFYCHGRSFLAPKKIYPIT